MSTLNNRLLDAVDGPWPLSVNILFLGAGTTQAAAQQVARSGVNRVLGSGGAGASMLLPALANEDEGADIIYVVNDSANAIAVFASLGDTLNGTLNGSISVAAGAYAHCLAGTPTSGMLIMNPTQVSTPDWRVAVQT